jgi:hypothetical protein
MVSVLQLLILHLAQRLVRIDANLDCAHEWPFSFSAGRCRRTRC